MNFYTFREVSKKLDISLNKVYYYIRKGYITNAEIAERKVIYEDQFNKLALMVATINNYIRPEEYCKKKGITLKAFYYRQGKGQIDTVKVGNKFYIKGVKK